MQNLEVMGVIHVDLYVKFMSNLRRAQSALSPCMSEITCRITSEKNLRAKITSRVTSMQNLQVIFTSEIHIRITSEITSMQNPFTSRGPPYPIRGGGGGAAHARAGAAARRASAAALQT